MGTFGATETLASLDVDTVRAESVELKALLLPPPGPIAEALTGRRAPTWSVRQVYLLDTASLDLVAAGMQVRLRRRARGRYDLSVSADRAGPGSDQSAPPGVRVELDVVPGALWRDLEVRGDVEPASAAAVIAGSVAPGTLLSRPQRSWVCTGGREPVRATRLTELRVHGPLVVRRVKVAAEGLGRADLEHFRFPSGRELVELSTHCCPADVLATADAFDRLLDERGIAIAPAYVTKTSAWQDEIGRSRAR